MCFKYQVELGHTNVLLHVISVYVNGPQSSNNKINY